MSSEDVYYLDKSFCNEVCGVVDCARNVLGIDIEHFIEEMSPLSLVDYGEFCDHFLQPTDEQYQEYLVKFITQGHS